MNIDKTLNKYIGSRIRSRRRLLNWNSTELAQKLNISRQQVQKYEQGITSVSIQILYKLSKIFSVNTNYFYEGMPKLEYHLFKSASKDIKETGPFNRTKPLDLMIVEPYAQDELLIRSGVDKSGIQTNIIAFHKEEDALSFLKSPMSPVVFPKPELIFLEITLLKGAGGELLNTIKKDQNLCDIPVVIITNSISYDQMLTCYKSQAAGFMRKPHNSHLFEESIKTILIYWGQTMSLPRMDDFNF